MSKIVTESIKVAIAIKAARTALGLSQLEFSEKLNVSKTTLARIETLESDISLNFYISANKVLNELGIYLDVMTNDDVVITIKPEAQQMVVDVLADESNRRADKKKSEVK